MFDAPVRTIHRPFFSPAQEPQDPRLGIAEDATNRGLRAEAGKPKRIIEPAWFSHPVIMPDFSPRGEGETPGNRQCGENTGSCCPGFVQGLGRLGPACGLPQHQVQRQPSLDRDVGSHPIDRLLHLAGSERLLAPPRSTSNPSTSSSRNTNASSPGVNSFFNASSTGPNRRSSVRGAGQLGPAPSPSDTADRTAGRPPPSGRTACGPAADREVITRQSLPFGGAGGVA